MCLLSASAFALYICLCITKSTSILFPFLVVHLSFHYLYILFVLFVMLSLVLRVLSRRCILNVILYCFSHHSKLFRNFPSFQMKFSLLQMRELGSLHFSTVLIRFSSSCPAYIFSRFVSLLLLVVCPFQVYNLYMHFMFLPYFHEIYPVISCKFNHKIVISCRLILLYHISSVIDKSFNLI